MAVVKGKKLTMIVYYRRWLPGGRLITTTKRKGGEFVGQQAVVVWGEGVESVSNLSTQLSLLDFKLSSTPPLCL